MSEKLTNSIETEYRSNEEGIHLQASGGTENGDRVAGADKKPLGVIGESWRCWNVALPAGDHFTEREKLWEWQIGEVFLRQSPKAFVKPLSLSLSVFS